jgi:hypothetical protein
MSQTEQDKLIDNLKSLRKDLSIMQTNLTEIIRAVAALPTENFASATRRCPICGVTTRGPISLDEHMHTSHNGPLPEAWARAEQAAGLATDQ